MIFAHFLVPEVNEANMFVVACPETRKAMLIDAAAYDARIPAFLERRNLTLESVFITHAHYDHTGGLAEIARAYKPTVFAGVADVDGVSAQQVTHGSVITLGAIQARVVELPGHTPEEIGLVFPSMAFTGDALFSGSIGGTTNLHNKATEIDAIRKHIFTLPDECLVHTGHGPSSTVAIEKNHNPFFV
ncbi:MAG TPA: MBL fold metallo-hydrolase [Candidatus Hydrogenedentes bacterium]|nr:MBL fold metallo-hydrolase [Candidatus Hydrogenedentota bacterium]